MHLEWPRKDISQRVRSLKKKKKKKEKGAKPLGPTFLDEAYFGPTHIFEAFFGHFSYIKSKKHTRGEIEVTGGV